LKTAIELVASGAARAFGDAWLNVFLQHEEISLMTARGLVF